MKKRVFLLFTSALLTAFTLSGQGIFGGLTNKEDPKITETDFKTLLDGFWEGEGSQLGTKWSMELYYDNNAKHFTIRYPSLSCVGRWDITKVSQKVLTVKETITDGKGNCKKEGEVRIRFVSANEVKMEFYEINGLIPLAKASLNYKKDKIPEIETPKQEIETPKHEEPTASNTYVSPKTDLQKKNLKGKVKSIIEKETYKPSTSYINKYYYNEQGMLLKYEDDNTTIECSYNNEGLLINRKNIAEEASYLMYYKDEHQELGNRTFVYNEKKQLIKSHTDNDLTSYFYDNNGLLIKSHRIYNSKNMGELLLLYVYDSKGYLTAVHSDEIGPYPRASYKYDEKGRVIVEAIDNGVIIPISISYNDKDDVIKETGKDWESVDFVITYAYTYDNHNNWIKCIKTHTVKYGGGADEVETYTITRTITYYE